MSTVVPEGAAAAGRGLRFGEVAELYERRRPGYPAALVADVLAAAGPPPTVLEVGAGTGRATRLLAAAGATVVALEPDPSVAKVWRRACADLAATSSGDAGGATLLDGTLEEVAGGDTAPAAPSGGGFGVVAAAQAWHWVDQQRGPALARRVMRPGGVLAAFWNTPLDGEGYESLIDVYRSLAPDMAPGMATSAWAAEMDTRRNVLARADGFDGPEVRHYDWAEPYGARALAELVQTYSGHRTLDPAVLERLTRGVADMVDRRPGGTVELGYRSVLLLARRVD